MAARTHLFYAVAFEENFPIKELSPHFPAGRLSAKELRVKLAEGEAFLYAFGAIVFCDVPAELRTAELERLGRIRPNLTTRVVREDFTAREADDGAIGIEDGVLVVDRLTPQRTGIIALTVAQSAAMEYYEQIVDRLFARTGDIVGRLERIGTVPMRTRPLHRFIGEALGTRNEVLSVLHLLDKPDETWDDPAMDAIYADLRAEFDLVDRYESLGSKLESVQKSLELVLDVARDRRMVALEVSIVVLFVFEVLMELFRRA